MKISRGCANTCGYADRALRIILGGCALASSILCIYSCQFFAYRTLDGQPWEGLSPPFDTLNKAAVGLFAYSDATKDANVAYGDSCSTYPDWKEVGNGRLFLVAQWCGLFAAVSGFLGWTVVTTDSCFFDSAATTVMSAFFFFAAAALQMSTFLVFGDTEFCLEASSQNKCRFGSGAWYSLGAAGAYGILFILSLIMPRSQNINFFFCCQKTDKEKDDQDADQEKRSENDRDTSDEDRDEDRFEDESAIDVYSKDSGAWTVEEELTYRDDQPISPPISPTSALTIPSAMFSDEDDEDNAPAASLPRMGSILRPSSHFTPTSPTASTTVAQTEETEEKGTDIMDMLCGDPLQAATSFSLNYGEGVQTNLDAMNKEAAAKQMEHEGTATQ